MRLHQHSRPASVLIAAARLDGLQVKTSERPNCFGAVLCASTLSEVMDASQKSGCDIALISPTLQDGLQAGFHAIRVLAGSAARMRTLLLLERYDPQLVLQGLAAGAKGVFYHGESAEALCRAVQQVKKGRIRLGKPELEAVLESVAQVRQQRQAA